MVRKFIFLPPHTVNKMSDSCSIRSTLYNIGPENFDNSIWYPFWLLYWKILNIHSVAYCKFFQRILTIMVCLLLDLSVFDSLMNYRKSKFDDERSLLFIRSLQGAIPVAA